MATTPDTAAINVSLPSPLKSWVEQIVSTGGYGSVSEYVRELIRTDQKRRRSQEELEALLLEGLNSGEPIEVTPEFWAKKRADLITRIQERSTKK